jgi:hypothetical protein
MDKTTARALGGLFVAFNHAMSPTAAALVSDILLQLADESPDREVSKLYRSMVGSVVEDERDPLPARPDLRVVRSY